MLITHNANDNETADWRPFVVSFFFFCPFLSVNSWLYGIIRAQRLFISHRLIDEFLHLALTISAGTYIWQALAYCAADQEERCEKDQW